MRDLLTVPLACIVAVCGCSAQDPSGADAGLDETTDGQGSETTDPDPDPDPEFPPGSEQLVGDACEVEELWFTAEDWLVDLALGEPGELFLTGRHQNQAGYAQVTVHVVDGALAWRELYEQVEAGGNSSPTGQRVVPRDDGTLWVFGHHQNERESWIAVYDSEGMLLWARRDSGFQWLDAADSPDAVFATAWVWADGLPHDALVHALDGDGATSWSFQSDDLPVHPWGVATLGEEVWAVGGGYSLPHDCGWWAHLSVDGQPLGVDCPTPADPDDDGESYNDVLILADGARVVGGRDRVDKPKNVGSISFAEPLVALLDAEGKQQTRWTYGPGVYLSGEVVDMAELPGGGFVVVSQEEDRGVDTDYDSPTMLRFDASGTLVARCELDRVSIPNYYGVFDALAVGDDGQIYALVTEGTVGSSDPLDDPEQFPPVPEDFPGQRVVRISGLDGD